MNRIQPCCRLCLAPDSECVAILGTRAADKQPISTKIQACVSIQVSAHRLSHISLISPASQPAPIDKLDSATVCSRRRPHQPQYIITASRMQASSCSFTSTSSPVVVDRRRLCPRKKNAAMAGLPDCLLAGPPYSARTCRYAITIPPGGAHHLVASRSERGGGGGGGSGSGGHLALVARSPIHHTAGCCCCCSVRSVVWSVAYTAGAHTHPQVPAAQQRTPRTDDEPNQPSSRSGSLVSHYETTRSPFTSPLPSFHRPYNSHLIIVVVVVMACFASPSLVSSSHHIRLDSFSLSSCWG